MTLSVRFGEVCLKADHKKMPKNPANYWHRAMRLYIIKVWPFP